MRLLGALMLLALLGCQDVLGIDPGIASGGGVLGVGGVGGSGASGGGGSGAAGPGSGGMGGTGGAESAYAAEVLDASPLAYWRLGEAAGEDIALDQATNHHGTYEGSPSLGAVGVLPDDTAVEMTSPGENVRIGMEGLDFIGREPFSVELWLFLPSAPDDEMYVVQNQGNDVAGKSQGWRIAIQPGSPPRARFVRKLDDGNDEAIGEGVEPQTWVHIVGTYDGFTMTLYLNGVEVDQRASSKVIVDHDDPLRIGGRGGSSFQTLATIDEVAIYDDALSAQDVAAHYATAISL